MLMPTLPIMVIACAIWMLELPTGAVCFILGQVRRSPPLRLVGVALGIFGLPVHLFFAPYYPGMIMDVRSAAEVPGYRIEYVQGRGFRAHPHYFLVTRVDGLQARVEIRYSAQCWGFKTQQVEAKIYFICPGVKITKRTPYLDTESYSLFPSQDQANPEVSIVKLDFKPVDD